MATVEHDTDEECRERFLFECFNCGDCLPMEEESSHNTS
jgi:hypothetical protein